MGINHTGPVNKDYLQTAGNCATVGGRVDVRLGTLNVGTVQKVGCQRSGVMEADEALW